MKKYLIIMFLSMVSRYSDAQTRRVFVKESLLYTYTTKGYNPGIIIIKSGGDSITVAKYNHKTDYGNQYWSSIYKGDTVLIEEFDLEQITTEKRVAERKKQIVDSIAKRILLIKKYGVKMGAFISDGYIKRGMTKQQAKYSWGEPNQIHRTVFSGGVHEQWIYNNSQYLYFENGILTAWQD